MCENATLDSVWTWFSRHCPEFIRGNGFSLARDKTGTLICMFLLQHIPQCIYHTSLNMLRKTEWTKNNIDECRFVIFKTITFSDSLRGAFSPAAAGLQPRNTKQRDGSSMHMLHSWVGALPKAHGKAQPHLYTLPRIKQDCKSVCCPCSNVEKLSVWVPPACVPVKRFWKQYLATQFYREQE